MTIVAGFRCLDGVILGADSLVENLDIKYEENKVFLCSPTEGYEVLLAGSGDTLSIKNLADFAMSEGWFEESKDSIPELKKAIRRLIKTTEYSDTVREAKEAKQPVEFLLALKSTDGKTDLVYLYQSRLYPVIEYECIGSGFSTARYFAKWLYHPDLPIRIMGPLAIQIFKAVKEHNVGCEGDTKLSLIFNGDLGKDEVPNRKISDAQFLGGLHDLLRPIFRCCIDSEMPDDYFRKVLDDLGNKAIELRRSNQQMLALHKQRAMLGKE